MDKWVENIYNDLLELSDIDKQKEYWLGRSGKYASSYAELMCRLFDDDSFDLFLDKDAYTYGFPEELIQTLLELRAALNSYSEKETDLDIIEDPDWLRIVDKARTVVSLWDKTVR